MPTIDLKTRKLISSFNLLLRTMTANGKNAYQTFVNIIITEVDSGNSNQGFKLTEIFSLYIHNKVIRYFPEHSPPP